MTTAMSTAPIIGACTGTDRSLRPPQAAAHTILEGLEVRAHHAKHPNTAHGAR